MIKPISQISASIREADMPSKFFNVTKGERLPGIPAATWNGLMDVGRAFERSGRSGAGLQRDGLPQGTRCLVHNNTGGDVDEFRTLAVSDVHITPTENETEFKRRMLVTAGDPTSASTSLVITQEPIPAGAIGIGLLAGASIARINVNDAGDAYCTPAAGGVPESTSTSSVLRIIWKESGIGNKWAYLTWAGIDTDDHARVNDNDSPANLEEQFENCRKEADTEGEQYASAADLQVYFETTNDAGDRKIQGFVNDPADGGSYGLEISDGKLHLKLSTAEYAPTLEFQISSGYLQARVKKYKLALNSGAIEIQDGSTYGAWVNVAEVGTCS
jgi:hypothetical protein